MKLSQIQVKKGIKKGMIDLDEVIKEAKSESLDYSYFKDIDRERERSLIASILKVAGVLV